MVQRRGGVHGLCDAVFLIRQVDNNEGVAFSKVGILPRDEDDCRGRRHIFASARWLVMPIPRSACELPSPFPRFPYPRCVQTPFTKTPLNASHPILANSLSSLSRLPLSITIFLRCAGLSALVSNAGVAEVVGNADT